MKANGLLQPHPFLNPIPQGVTESLIQHTVSQEDTNPSQSPQPQQITTVAAHQSGVNSIAFHHCPDNAMHITMATGGDDNKISVWEVLVEISEGVEVLVTHLCSVFGHASQVSGMYMWFCRGTIPESHVLFFQIF